MPFIRPNIAGTAATGSARRSPAGSILLAAHGYALVCCSYCGLNAFFVRQSDLDRFRDVPSDPTGLFRPALYIESVRPRTCTVATHDHAARAGMNRPCRASEVTGGLFHAHSTRSRFPGACLPRTRSYKDSNSSRNRSHE